MLQELREQRPENYEDPSDIEISHRILHGSARIDIPLRDFNHLTSRVPSELEDLANRLRQLRREDKESVVSRIVRAEIYISSTRQSVRLTTTSRKAK